MKAYLEVLDDGDTGCEFYCESCAPERCAAYSDGGGEADYPQHCCICDEPLENPLTDDGVEYVLDAIRQSLSEPRSERDVVRDWAMQLLDYDLADKKKRIVWHFLERTAADRSARCGITHWTSSDDGASI